MVNSNNFMIIFLYGPDSYRKNQNLSKLIDGFRQKNSVFSEENFDCKIEDDFLKFKDFLGQQTMFSSKKLAVLKNAFELGGKEKENLKELLKKNIKSDESFIIIDSDKEPRGEFEFLLDLPKNNVLKFGDLEGARMEHYINTEAERLGISLTPQATVFLAKVFERNTWGLETELEKLRFLHPEEKKKIGIEDIEEMLVYFQTSNTFILSNLISKKYGRQQILPVLETLFLNNEEAAKIFNFISANPFLNFESVKKMADYDVAIKSGKLDYETALLDLVIS